ncbi:hypothetical protein B2J69_18525 [Pantoea latae]|uniref:Resolvase HTH domain-containing protein n=1 Tax=Pantoea latae TaxID=1964541 RepID=A0A1V9DC00_9GAMM|nr:hypothetical protein B2J69_18525 [Pantoea latae]
MTEPRHCEVFKSKNKNSAYAKLDFKSSAQNGVLPNSVAEKPARSALNEEQEQVVIEHINPGLSISAIAREFSITRQTISRAKAKSTISED